MEKRVVTVEGLQIERLELLLSVARDLASILELDRLLNRVGHLLRDVIPYEHFSIFLYDREREELTWRIGIGYSEESRRWLQRIPVTKGLVGRAVRTRSSVLSNDVSVEPDFLPATTHRGEAPRSALAVPLIHQGEPVGVIVLESTRIGDFSAEQEQMLSVLGATLAIAIVNARLYEELRSRERKLDNDLQLADVSGKGVGAAMIMAASRGAVRSPAQQEQQPNAVLYTANRRLHRDIKRNVYVTMCYGVLDPTRGSLTYTNAGHFPPALIPKSGEVSYLQAGGTVLGMFDGTSFEQDTIKLRSGDLICFSTDGIVDALNENDEVYGEPRLEKLLLATRRLPAAGVARP